MWHFEYEAEKHTRLHRYFWSCQTGFDGPTMWWCNREKMFVPDHRSLPEGGSNCSPPIRTFRAFKRFLRNHPELQGVSVILVNRYIGFNITAVYKPV